MLVIGIIAGIVTNYVLPVEVNNKITSEFIGSTFDQLEGKHTHWDYSEYLFLHNFRVNLMVVLTGVLTSLIPLFVVTLNGYAVGYLGAFMGKEKGLFWVLATLLPHGIFEFPAHILSGIIGIQLTFDARPHIRNIDIKSVGVVICKALWLYMSRVVPLLIIAAVIEGGAMTWTG